MRSTRWAAILVAASTISPSLSQNLTEGTLCYRFCINQNSACNPVGQQSACDTGLHCHAQVGAPEAYCRSETQWPGCNSAGALPVVSSGYCAQGVVSPVGTACTIRCASTNADGKLSCVQGQPAQWATNCASTTPTPQFLPTTPTPGGSTPVVPVVLSDSSDDSVTSKPWFWVLVVGLPLLLLSSLAFALWFLLFRKQRKGSEEENAPRHHAPGPPNPMQFKSPLRTGPIGAGPLRDGSGHFPLVSALKGPGSPKPPIGSPKRAVTFSAFHTGEKVEGYFEDKWYQAVIQSHNVDGTYTVLWLPDQAMTSVVTAQQLRRLNLSQGGTSYAMSDYDYYETEGDSMVGTLVQCLWQQEWHTGTVEVVNPDGTYLIRWPDGTYTPNVDRADTKRKS
eukprot:Rhum_TRINITY_DN3603_c0_g1::Rhum_TRINITY_DN3603_c0_g1_i1::g.11464::m.11464